MDKEFCLTYKKDEQTALIPIFSVTFMLMLLLLILAITETPIRVHSQPNRYYAGYLMYGYATYAPWGVYAQIYTIDPGFVWWWDVFAEWDAVVLSYTYDCWIQVGYTKEGFNLRFYLEKKDNNGRQYSPYPTGPSPGVTYSYTIVNVKGGMWCVRIRDLNGYTLYETTISVSPYEPKDLEASAETSNPSIHLDGTHFMYLSYYTGRSWPLWNMHVSAQDWPYTLTQVSHYEFYASGGT
ncbi:MAG: hypothetical protein QXF52_07280 [Thermoproteota archaeon]